MPWRPEVRNSLDALLQSNDDPRIAVFDADGTLWSDDLGEAFFKFQIQNHLAPGILKIKDPWQFYKKSILKDPYAAYGWLAQINEGVPQATLRSHCADFFRRHFRSKVGEEMRALVAELVTHQFEVWVCSASIRWVIEAGAMDLGLSPSRVIAVETRVDANDVITAELVTPLPYASGKKNCLVAKLKAPPLLVAGNSMGDFDMLTMARLPLVIQYLPHRAEVQVSEASLLAEATGRGWLVQNF